MLRLHVHGGVRALVPMLSADIPRDRPRARACGATILSLRNRAFFQYGPLARWERGYIRKVGTWPEGSGPTWRGRYTFNFSEGGGSRGDSN